MPSHAGPRTLKKENLVFLADTNDTTLGITSLGCGGFTTSNQGIKNIVDGTIYQFQNGMKLTGRDFFTAFAIDYPEGSYGGDAVNRNGITPGYDVRLGTKTYDTSRALHLWVWNNKTNSWVADSFFHGYRLYGHCYDSYIYADAPGGYSAELGRFVDDFNTIKATFPDCTYIVMGSHRDSYRNSTVRNILYDLGMPTGTALDSDYIAAPEWILVGKPGLGAGNAYGWVYENYTTNPGYVAHMNFGLPIKSKGSMYFDGSNDYISVTDSTILDIEGDKTLSCWVNFASDASCGIVGKSSSATYGMALGYGWGGNGFMALAWNSVNAPYIAKDAGRDYGKWVYLNAVQSGSTRYIYVWDAQGLRTSSYSGGTHTWNNNVPLMIGNANNGSNPAPAGTLISHVAVYNVALTPSEIEANFKMHKSKYGL
jgi:hypothetical protein